jgi:hypothetical protein
MERGLRLVAALIAAAAVDVAVVVGGERLVHAGWPGPWHPFDAAPFAAKFALVVTWSVAAFAASATALAIGKTGPWLAWLVTALAVAAIATNFVAFHHPAWMIALGVVGPMLGAGAALFWLRPREMR